MCKLLKSLMESLAAMQQQWSSFQEALMKSGGTCDQYHRVSPPFDNIKPLARSLTAPVPQHNALFTCNTSRGSTYSRNTGNLIGPEKKQPVTCTTSGDGVETASNS